MDRQDADRLPSTETLIIRLRAMKADLEQLHGHSCMSPRNSSPGELEASGQTSATAGSMVLAARIEEMHVENQSLKGRLKSSEAEAATLRTRLADAEARVEHLERAAPRRMVEKSQGLNAASGTVDDLASDSVHSLSQPVRRPSRTAWPDTRNNTKAEAKEVMDLFGSSMGPEVLQLELERRCLAELRKEVARGGVLSVANGKVVVMVELVRVYLLADVNGESRCLIEHDHFELADCQQSTVMLPLATRLRPGEDWKAAMYRAFRVKVGLQERWQESLLTVDFGSYFECEETSQFGDFANVLVCSKVHEVYVRVTSPTRQTSSKTSGKSMVISPEAFDRAVVLDKLGLPSGRDFVTRSEREDGVTRLHVWCWKSREYERNGKLIAFSRYLESRGFNVSELGNGANKSLFEFYVEVKEKQTSNLVEVPDNNKEGCTQLLRVVELLKIRLLAEVHGRRRVLSESEQFMDDGRKRKANQLLVKKMRQGSDWREVWKQVIQDRLDIDPVLQDECFRIDDTRIEYAEEMVPAHEYCSLQTNFKVNTVVVEVVNPEHPDLYRIGLPRGNDFVTRDAQYSRGEGGKVHVWTWVPNMEEDADEEPCTITGTALEDLNRGLHDVEHLILQTGSNPQIESLGMETLFKQALHRVQWCMEKISNIDATLSDVDVHSWIRSARRMSKAAHDKEITNVDTRLAEFITTNFTQAPRTASKSCTGTVFESSHLADDSPVDQQGTTSEDFGDYFAGFPNLQEIVDGRDTWGFDFFELSVRSGQQVLESYGLVVMVPLCQQALKCGRTPARAFLDKVVAGYYPNPYHNAVHAAQVCHLANWLGRCLGIAEKQSEQERCAFVIAALGHDLRHFGRNNAFCVSTEHVLSLRYNNQKVLENMHSATCLELLETVQLLTSLSRQERNNFRAHIIEYILATDMAEHFEVISKFRVRKEAPDFSICVEADRRFVSRMCIKAGDIGHSSMPWPLHQQWSVRVAEEFYAQGDEEQRLGLPISALCDRSKLNDFGKSQKGFLEFVSLPLFEVLAAVQVDSESTDAQRINVSDGVATNRRPAADTVDNEADPGTLNRRSWLYPSGSSSRAQSHNAADDTDGDKVPTLARRRSRQYTAPASITPSIFSRSVRGGCIAELEANAIRWAEDAHALEEVKEALLSKAPPNPAEAPRNTA